MSLVEPSTDPAIEVIAFEPHHGGVRMSDPGGRSIGLHPIWLRGRTHEHGQIDPTNRQRLFTPLDVPPDLAVVAARRADGRLLIEFSDGHVAFLDIGTIATAVGWTADPEEPPPAEPWDRPLDPLPTVSWDAIGWDDRRADATAVMEALGALRRHGFVVISDTPAVEGTVRKVCDRLGYISGNNFGWVFDVRAEARPTDLAYTPIGLLAHTDQPYRRPVPGIQLLHCIRNDAPGGDSTLADGRAGALALAGEDPDAHAALVRTDVVWRYDMVSDTVVGRGRILEYDDRGSFRAIRLNTKLDEPEPGPGVDLDAFYRGRRRLCEWLDDPAHQVRFRLRPGDVLVMDNERTVHGRTPFDPAAGQRHLQGAYIDHDGPDTLWRLTVRRFRDGG